MDGLRQQILGQGYLRLDGRLASPVAEAAQLAADPALRLEVELELPDYRSLRLHYAGRQPADPGIQALDALAGRIAREVFAARSQSTLQLTETWAAARPGRLIQAPHIDGYGDRIRPLVALLVVLLTAHAGEAEGLYVVPGSVGRLASLLDRPFRAAAADGSQLCERINGAVAGSYGPSAPRHFLAGPAGSVFLLHPLAAHGVVAPAAGVRLRRALLRLYPADLSLRDATACEAEARAVEQPFGRWQQALARLRDLCAVA